MIGSNPFGLVVLQTACETFEELITTVEKEGFKPQDFTLMPTCKKSLESMKRVLEDIENSES